MEQFQSLINHVLTNGKLKGDRTGTGTISTFGYQMRFNLADGFPICTTKKVPFKSVLSELLWFLSGSTNVNDLRALLHGEENRFNPACKTIWDDNYENQAKQLGYKDGHLGPIYGKQWREWPLGSPDLFEDTPVVDQITNVISMLRTNPDDRRMIVSAWNPAQLGQMALPPCHALYQFYTEEMTQEERVKWFEQVYDRDFAVAEGMEVDSVLNGMCVPSRKLSCQLYQRSADVFLGVPFNIASYALLVHMIAQITNMVPGEFIWTGGDTHIYTNHIEQCKTVLSREPLPLPKLHLTPFIGELSQFTMDDFLLENYQSHDAVKAPMAV